MNQIEREKIIKELQDLVAHDKLEEAEERIAVLEQKTEDKIKFDPKLYVDISNEKGKIAFRRGKYENAKKLINDALNTALEASYEYGEAYARNYLGAIIWSMGDPDIGLEFFKESLEIRHRIGDLAGESASLHNIATALSQRGQILKAIEVYNKAVEVEREIGNKPVIVLTLNNIGASYCKIGDLTNATPFLKEAQKIAQEIGMKTGVAQANHNLGIIAWAQGNRLEAKAKFLECTEYWIAEKREDAMLADALRDFAELYSEDQDFTEANLKLETLKQIAETRSSDVIRIYWFYALGTVSKNQGDAAKAQQAFIKALTIAQKQKLFTFILKSLIQLAEINLNQFRMTLDENFFDIAQGYILEAQTAAKDQKFTPAIIETTIIKGMLFTAAMDLHQATKELQESVQIAKSQGLINLAQKAENQLERVAKLWKKVGSRPKTENIEQQVEEIKAYIGKFQQILKAFKT